jgi:hypothetical protein
MANRQEESIVVIQPTISTVLRINVMLADAALFSHRRNFSESSIYAGLLPKCSGLGLQYGGPQLLCSVATGDNQSSVVHRGPLLRDYDIGVLACELMNLVSLRGR